jgi:ribosome biogenesis GTPase A
MDSNHSAAELTRKLEALVSRKLGSLFQEYGMDMNDILASLKWKPLVLIIGNYSSGKSTFINEVLGRDVQRTGQAPTDDSFGYFLISSRHPASSIR